MISAETLDAGKQTLIGPERTRSHAQVDQLAEPDLRLIVISKADVAVSNICFVNSQGCLGQSPDNRRRVINPALSHMSRIERWEMPHHFGRGDADIRPLYEPINSKADDSIKIDPIEAAHHIERWA